MSKDLAPLFANPPAGYRPIPFWSWNGDLRQEELTRQVCDMAHAGDGGFFMHARGGLQTPYMKKKWFRLCSACIEEASRQGIRGWAYDENGWPSGFGDGRVNGLGEKYQQKYLRFRKVTAVELKRGIPHQIAVYDLQGNLLPPTFKADAGDGGFWVAYFEVNPGYVDNMDPEVVRTFLDRVYAEYERNLSEEDRKRLAGFFTDEPQLSRNGIPWSFTLPGRYREAYGENLLEHLPELFDWRGLLQLLPDAQAVRQEEASRTRLQFWRLVTILFRDSYLKQIYEWCEERHWKLTGHQVLEETYEDAITCNGSIMPHYEYYHIPGMDQLCRRHTGVMTPIQLTSAAMQCGKKQILAETFACCGWNVTIAELKWLFQWKTLYGVNLLCQHLAGYSLLGIRKRDYPASHSYQQPCWKEYAPFHDAVARTGLLLAEGTPQVELLVLHGMSTGHLLCGDADWERHSALYSQALERLSEKLSAALVEHHYGDETMMHEKGRVLLPNASVPRPLLQIGKMRYRRVLIPQLLALTSRQVGLLQRFQKAGGEVYAVRNTIDRGIFYLDGKRANLLELLPGITVFCDETAAAQALAMENPYVKIMQDANSPCTIRCTTRKLQNFKGLPAQFYYFINDSSDKEAVVQAKLLVRGEEAWMLNAVTGECLFLADAHREGEWLSISHSFAYAEDFLLITKSVKGAVPSHASLCHCRADDKAAMPLLSGNSADLPWEIAAPWENQLTIDRCSWTTSDGQKGEDEYVLTAQQHLLEMRRPVDISLEYVFQTDVSYPLGTALDVVIENPRKWKISVNGRTVRVPRKPDFFVDRGFLRIPIGHLVRTGRNCILLEGRFSQTERTYAVACERDVFEGFRNKLTFDTEIESIYLCGPFGVKMPGKISEGLSQNAFRYHGDFLLSAPPQTLLLNQYLGKQGLPFFAGTLCLRKTVAPASWSRTGKCCFALRECCAEAAVLAVNGVPLAHRIAPPYRWDIPAELLKGKQAIQLELSLVSSLRNLLGPHHMQEGESLAVGPGSFLEVPGAFNAYHPLPWNDGFCFVPFGAVLQC